MADKKEKEQKAEEIKEEVTVEETPDYEAQLKEVSDKYLYLAAEYDNYRKRTAKEKESIYSTAVADTLEALLPFIDDYERAVASPCTDEAYKKGIDMVSSKLAEFMKKQGIEEIDTNGEFDPEVHNAVLHEENDELGENIISQVLAKGYKIGGKVVRPAMVKVAN